MSARPGGSEIVSASAASEAASIRVAAGRKVERMGASYLAPRPHAERLDARRARAFHRGGSAMEAPRSRTSTHAPPGGRRGLLRPALFGVGAALVYGGWAFYVNAGGGAGVA